ncbi:hypothetical protein BC826DRAFT_1017142 [Russula brevipes]|nr:hypothetical protein BC826DRAFT_1017142 [Russula brevipes]
MAAVAVYATQVSAGGYPHMYDYGRVSPPPTPLSPTLLNAPRSTERPSIKLKIPGGTSDIFNSAFVDAAGRTLYSISSTSKRTTLFSCKDNVEVATINWDRSSPRMVFCRKKLRCREWLPLAGPETESRILTHGAAQYISMHQSTSGYLIPANRPGLAVAKWRTKSHDELRLEVFQEALVEPGLLDAIVLSFVLIRAGRSLGDGTEAMMFSDPRFFPPGMALH